MTTRQGSVLLIGYGNPGRLDDGLGPAFARELDALDLPDVTIDSDYQLTVEDAHAVATHDCVVFVDAALTGPAPFAFRVLEPIEGAAFSSHGVEPAEVLWLARSLFNSEADAYVLGIRGYCFNEFGELLSDSASSNLRQALRFLERVIREDTFDREAEPAEVLQAGASTPAPAHGRHEN